MFSVIQHYPSRTFTIFSKYKLFSPINFKLNAQINKIPLIVPTRIGNGAKKELRLFYQGSKLFSIEK